eukprot:8907520-Pyramimonas_sp.AAC.1
MSHETVCWVGGNAYVFVAAGSSGGAPDGLRKAVMGGGDACNLGKWGLPWSSRLAMKRCNVLGGEDACEHYWGRRWNPLWATVRVRGVPNWLSDAESRGRADAGMGGRRRGRTEETRRRGALSLQNEDPTPQDSLETKKPLRANKVEPNQNSAGYALDSPRRKRSGTLSRNYS